MLTGLNLFTFVWLAGWSVVAAAMMARGSRNAILFVFPVHFLFCGLPLLLDFLIGKPDYVTLPGIAEAANDPVTSLLYCLYVGVCPLIWWGCTRKHVRKSVRLGPSRPVRNRLPAWLRAALIVAILAPFGVLLVAPEPDMYLAYTPYQRDLHVRPEAAFSHVFMTYATLVSLLASSYMLLRSARFSRTLLMLAPFLFFAFWLNGKRNIVAVGVGLLIYVAWKRGLLNGWRAYVVPIALGLAFMLYSQYYQSHWRYPTAFTAARTAWDWYENYRIDYGRDHIIKLSLHALRDPGQFRVLDYPGQSLVIYATALMPRYLWPEKPASYAYRLTASATQEATRESGGALTTSILDEALSNFGWAGVLLGPLILVLVSHLGNACRDELALTLTVLMTFFLQTTHLLAIYPFFLLWLGMVILKHQRRAPVHTPTHPPRVRTPSGA